MRKPKLNHRRNCFHSFYCLILQTVLLILAAMIPWRGSAAGTWATVAAPAPGGVSLMLLLTDGSVMCQNSGNVTWYRLIPDSHGSYVNGAWTTIAPMNYSRRYYSSQVLRDGRVFIAGAEYGTGGTNAEIYDPVANTWTVAPNTPGGDDFIDSISEILPNGNVLVAPVSPSIYGGTLIWNAASNTWSNGPALYRGDDQDEASWVKLADNSILTVDPFGQNSERYIPALNQWVNDGNLPTPVYGWGGELGAGFLLPNGKAFYIGATNHTAIYTPTGTTSPGTWIAGANIPNNLGAVDSPAAMMANGNILCALGTDTNFGSVTYFYEYNYASNSFAQVSSPTGGTTDATVPYGCSFLDLPDGTVLFSGNGSQLYVYTPSGTPVASGIPAINTVTTNLDGSFHVTGTLFNGISEGAAYGDDEQMRSDYPIARFTNSSGKVFYGRTYDWSSTGVMTGTNVVSTEMTLPPGLLPGTLSMVISANGIASSPYSLAISGTLLPPVTGLALTTIASNELVLDWKSIGLTETGYLVQRSTDGSNYSTVANLASNVTSYTDALVTPLGQYYYRVLGTNSVGIGIAAPTLFAASSPVVAVSAPWQSRDIGAVAGRGAAGVTTGGFTMIGSGSGAGGTNDEFQYVYQPIAGDVTITARVASSQNTGANALAAVMIRNGLDSAAADAVLSFDAGNSNTVFQFRASGGATASGFNGSGGLTAPYWISLARSGNTITGSTSPDGITWTPQGSTTVDLEPVVYVGLAVSGGVTNLLNTSAFDNVAVIGSASATPIPVAEWKLNETSGSTAIDSRGGNDGTYENVALGQPGATPDLGYSAGFDGTNASVALPPLDLDSNVVTIAAWIKPIGTQSASAGIFFNRANSTVAGLTWNNSTANELSYTWNDNPSTYGWHSGLIAPNNQWSFVTLVVEATRARIYMVNNGVLQGATNNVANVVQNFDGTSEIGWDSTSTNRYFAGLMDDVEFFNQALTPTQISELGSTPTVSFSSPANGAEFSPPANITLTAAFSGLSGHTTNLVQFFNGDALVGEAFAPPFSVTATNLAAGNYIFTARLFYDSGLVVDSAPLTVLVESAPATPQNVIASALAGNLVYVSWSPVAGADGYILSRDGTAIAALGNTNFFLDGSVAPGSNYCYTVAATNQVGSSAASGSSCVTTPVNGIALNWDAGSIATGPEDGNGTWSTTSSTWWNGAAVVNWSDGNLAIFGAGTATNCVVSLTSSVTPTGIIFNSNSGGAYTITNTSGGIILSGTPVFIANNNSTIGVSLSGSGKLVKAGNSVLTLAVANTQTGGLTVNAGLVIAAAPNGTAYGATGNGNLLVNSGGTIEASGDNSIVGQTTSAAKTIVINAGGLVTNTASSSCHLNAVVLNGGVMGANTANGSYGNWNFDHGVSTLGNGNISTITGGNATVSETGGTVFTILAGDSVQVSTTLAHTSYGSDIGLIKSGAGALVLQAMNTYTSPTTVSAGTFQVDGSLAAGTVTVQSSATLAGAGTINGATTVQSGASVAPGDGGIGTLAFGGNLTLNSGSTTILELAQAGSSVTNDRVIVAGNLALGGTLVVTNIGSNALVTGDIFQLVGAASYSGTFASIILPTLPSGLVWITNNLGVTGTILVANSNYSLTYTAGANGTISGTSPQSVSYGGSGTAITAVPNAGYAFVNWSDGSTNDPRTDANVTNNVAVTANFVVPTFSLTYTAGANGTISGVSPQTVSLGGSGTAVTAVPNATYYFVDWSDGSTINPRTDTNVMGNLAVSAIFSNLIPSPWVTNKVGTVSAITAATYSNGVFTVTGAGSGLSNKIDNFWFINQPTTTSNFTITARVVSDQTNGSAPLAGVMIRQSTVTNSAFAFIGLTSGNHARWVDRTATNSNVSSTTFNNFSAPYWISVSRATNTFTSFLSPDGSTWTKAASVTFTGMTTNALVGLVVSSGSSSILETNFFDNVSVTNQGFTQRSLQPPPVVQSIASQFTGIGLEDGAVDFGVIASDNSTWMLEDSIDLINWTPLNEEMNVIGGEIEHTQSDDDTNATRFFQLVPEP
jgi:autotransporter-associated beta strand protein